MAPCPIMREAWQKVSTISRFGFVGLREGLSHFFWPASLTAVFCSPGQQICSLLPFGWSLFGPGRSRGQSLGVFETVPILLMVLQAIVWSFDRFFVVFLLYFVVQVNRFVVYRLPGQVFLVQGDMGNNLWVFLRPFLFYWWFCKSLCGPLTACL
jgi:hypothetical protein